MLAMSDHASPLGGVRAIWFEDRLCSLAFTEHWDVVARALQRRFRGVPSPKASQGARLGRALAAYFDGDLHALDDIPIDPGGTAFQRAVWSQLRRIPAGETTTYGALARAIGSPSAVRAVGAANGANPIWLIIPCHRAIGADGRLVGYAGGLERKRWLLAHEAGAAPQARLAL